MFSYLWGIGFFQHSWEILYIFLIVGYFHDGTISQSMRRDTLEKETRSCEGIEEYVKDLLEDIQANVYKKALDYLSLIHILQECRDAG